MYQFNHNSKIPKDTDGKNMLGTYLKNQTAIILYKNTNSPTSKTIIIPPLNTNINFNKYLPIYNPTSNPTK